MITVDSHIIQPNQPAFHVLISSSQSIAKDVEVALTLAAEYFDRGGDVSSNVFTAPVDGLYYFSMRIRLDSIASDITYMNPGIKTTKRNYGVIHKLGIGITYRSFTITLLVDMDEGDTAYPIAYQGGGTVGTVCNGTDFSGFLVC